MEISALSKEYVKVPIAAVVDGAAIDPTTDAVQMAFPLHGVTPVSGDWKAGSWETTPSGLYYARCLVGPGGAVALTADIYDCWVKVSDSPETVARRVGEVIVY